MKTKKRIDSRALPEILRGIEVLISKNEENADVCQWKTARWFPQKEKNTPMKVLINSVLWSRPLLTSLTSLYPQKDSHIRIMTEDSNTIRYWSIRLAIEDWAVVFLNVTSNHDNHETRHDHGHVFAIIIIWS